MEYSGPLISLKQELDTQSIYGFLSIRALERDRIEAELRNDILLQQLSIRRQARYYLTKQKLRQREDFESHKNVENSESLFDGGSIELLPEIKVVPEPRPSTFQ